MGAMEVQTNAIRYSSLLYMMSAEKLFSAASRIADKTTLAAAAGNISEIFLPINWSVAL
jgi:hypothetical protein